MLCECRQDRTLMDRSSAMTMAAAACYGGDVQVRTKEESIVQDFGEGNDDSCYCFCESLILPVFCGCSRVQNLQALKVRLWTASKAFKLHANHGALWVHLISCTTRSEGGGEEMDPMQVFPAGRR